MSSELFGTITESTYLKRLERRIRPFRMAIINVTQAGVDVPTYEYILNEFGSDLITGEIERPTDGVYSISFDVSAFHNVTKVIQESTLISTGVSTPMLTSTFTDSTKAALIVSIYNITEVTFADVDGEILIYIKEFYGS